MHLSYFQNNTCAIPDDPEPARRALLAPLLDHKIVQGSEFARRVNPGGDDTRADEMVPRDRDGPAVERVATGCRRRRLPTRRDRLQDLLCWGAFAFRSGRDCASGATVEMFWDSIS